jgi:hypothetical protein
MGPKLSQSIQAMATKTALFIALTFAAVPAFAEVHVALKSKVVIHDDVVRIADFLPIDAALQIRELASQFTLGSAPLPGQHRLIAREQIVRVLRGKPELESLLDVPAAIEITRWSRPLTTNDVLAAIQEELRANNSDLADSVTVSDVVIQAGVLVTEDRPTLKVTRIEPSQEGGGTHVRLWVSSEPRIPPFWANLDIMVGHSRTMASMPIGKDHSLDLVKTGEPVELVIQGHNLRITTKAVPLSAGVEGQAVRVRSVTTGKIVVATVIAAGSVELDY